VCACEPGFTCSKCAGTPFDPMYVFDEPEPMEVAEFDELTRWPVGEWWSGWK